VVARTESPAAALRLLDALPPERERFQPYHATRADVLARAGHDAEAADAYRTAANLTEDPATARFLWGRADALDPERSNI
jgi:RNA polymerase sigma-70 factor (ECF subfamily)